MSNLPAGYRSIKVKMCLILLPAILVGLILITGIAAYSSYGNISELAAESMRQTLRANNAEIHGMLQRMEIACQHLAYNAGFDYKTEDTAQMAKDIVDELEQEDLANGGGLWFEPFAYRPEVELFCPFTFRDNGKLSVDFNYVQSSGPYIPTDWYQGGKAAGAGKSFLTNPYFDPAAKTVMVTYASPIYAEQEGGGSKFIGVSTVDISLSEISERIASIKAGETGHAFLLSDMGIYVAGVEEEKLENTTYATDEKNASLAAAMKEVLARDSGVLSYEDDQGVDCILTYATMPDTGWKLVFSMPESELFAGARAMVWKLAIIAVVVLTILMLAAYRTIASYVARIATDQAFAEDLARGDYTRDVAIPKAKDEIGLLGAAMNQMFQQTRDVLKGIAGHAHAMSESSQTLGTSAETLTQGFQSIQDKMRSINDAMMNASSATEEVNASVEDVSSAVNVLSQEAAHGLRQAEDIQVRAKQVQTESTEASRSTEQLAKEFSRKLEASIEQARTVEEIGNMATAISGIAEQINLLSLNASIEAARAGESGRGFAVVAMEIGKLAKQTAETVEEIQATIRAVQDAFAKLSHDAQSILGFLNGTVGPQYEEFVKVAVQYGDDAEVFREVSQKIAETSSKVNDTMEQVSKAMLQIANSAQATADLSVQITGAVDEVSDSVREVSAMSQQQSDVAADLRETVSHFKLQR